MAEKKKQHYVPKFYMKNFADDRNNVAVYNIKTQKTIFHSILNAIKIIFMERIAL